jgi:DUF4097 and DUF4098 domain-containing protein YvlB
MKRKFAPLVMSGGTLVMLAAAGLLLAETSLARPSHGKAPDAAQRRHLIAEKTGSLSTRPGQALRLVTDWGDIVIHTHEAPRVDYRIRIETSSTEHMNRNLAGSFVISPHNTPAGVFLRGQRARDDWEKMERVWVTLDVTVPRAYSVDASTQGGSIQAPDLQGRVRMATGGGDIFVGNVRGSARLQTAGGHISVKNVSEDLDAETGGGHITAGKVSGSASLKTGGGHIRAAGIAREARLETAGGNISVGQSGGQLISETGGGQIDIGDAAGAIRARTGGGGIRVVSSSGPTQLNSQSGSIYLSRVISAVHAQTGSGGITAWLGAAGDRSTPCDLESRDGDIIVYIPSSLAMTIDATVRAEGLRHIYVDPMLPVKISREITGNSSGLLRAQAALNGGGGEVLRLKTMEGNIRLILSDQVRENLLYKQQMDEIKKQVQQQLNGSPKNDTGSEP